MKPLSSTYLWARLKLAYGRCIARILDFIHLQRSGDVLLERIGTDYGGWYCVRKLLVPGGNAICCGAGEDISFDVALNARFGLRVLCVDPTPRAIQHVQALVAAINDRRPMLIEKGPLTYQVDGFSQARFSFAPRAVWSSDGELDLYAPQDPTHVSYSALNLQRTSIKMCVRSSTIYTLVSEFAIGHIALLKLDIEGAEYEVIRATLRDGLLPDQILIEFDQVNQPLTVYFWIELGNVIRELRRAGYRLIYRQRANYVFVRQSALCA